MKIDQSVYAAILTMRPERKQFTIDEIGTLIDEGQKVVKKYGREWLDTKPLTEREMLAVSVLFEYELAVTDLGDELDEQDDAADFNTEW